jgi:hypothetical protein
MIQMLKILTFAIMLATILTYSQLSYADAKCRSVCYANYDKCVADVINQPEPRTYEEQQTLDECSQRRADCEHDCEDTSEPTEDQPKQEEGK